MESSTKKKVNPFLIVLIAMISIVSLLDFYLNNVSRLFNHCGEVYRREDVKQNLYGEEWTQYTYLVFTDNWQIDLIVTDETFDVATRYRYDYSVHTWDNIGDLYFRDDSVFLPIIIKEDVTPVTIDMTCIQKRAVGWGDDDWRATYEYAVGSNGEDDIRGDMFFGNNTVNFDGVSFSKMERIDTVIEEEFNAILDNEELFYVLLES